MSNKNIEKKLSDDIVSFFRDTMCAVYRRTFHEDEICNRLQNIAQNIDGVKVIREEETNNLIIWKRGNGKYQNADFPIILQAHSDMVCVASEQGDIDEIFSRGVETYCPPNFPNRLMGRSAANKNILTSLGADDGIGVAAIFAVLQNSEIVHPPIIAIITAEEEDGMSGAEKLQFENIKTAADSMGVDLKKAKLINIDDERDGIFSVSCAGGIRGHITLSLKRDSRLLHANAEYCRLSISELKGGHSGLVIDENRANAIVLLCDVLEKLQYTNLNPRVVTLDTSGVAPNAIPSSASAVIAIPQGALGNLKKRLAHVETYIKKNYSVSDGAIKIDVVTCGNDNSVSPYSNETQANIFSIVRAIPNGAIGWFANRADDPVVETSNNIGILKEIKNANGEQIEITCMIRSADDDLANKIAEDINARCEMFGGTFAQTYTSPAWKYRDENSLRDLFLNKYREVSGKEARAVAIHAGLECGHFAKMLGDIDMIACGPQLSGVHSINETLYLDTVPTLAKLLIAVLEDCG